MSTRESYPITARWRPHTEHPETDSAVFTAVIAESLIGGRPDIVEGPWYWSASTQRWVHEANDEWVEIGFTEFWWVPERELLASLPGSMP